jgi:hypothetical protein
MNWIKSGGGPLICLEATLADAWQGIGGSLEPNLPPGMTDYDRGCGVDTYLGIISVGGGSALLLGDMPLQTFVWKDLDEVIIARFIYAEAETELSDIMPTLDRRCFDNPVETLLYTNVDRDMVIFDSAYEGSSDEMKKLTFQLTPGNYRILTCPVEPDKSTSLVLRRFDRFQ